MGCTATAVYIWAVGTERFLQCANVGDSTAFLWCATHTPLRSHVPFCFGLTLPCSRNGTAVPLSIDHKVTAPAEKERVRAMGIEITDTQGRIAGMLSPYESKCTSHC